MAVITSVQSTGQVRTDTLSGEIRLDEGNNQLVIFDGNINVVIIDKDGFHMFDAVGERLAIGKLPNDTYGFAVAKEGSTIDDIFV